MNNKHHFAFYGSLRKGMYNNSYFQSGLKYLETVTIPGFNLFSLGSYPCVIQSENKNDTIVVDLFEAINQQTEDRIHRMELGAGYDYHEVEISGKIFGIYVYDKQYTTALLAQEKWVPGGDWVKYLHAKNVIV